MGSGQSQFAALKLRSLALVSSSGALTRSSELHSRQLHCKTLPSAPGAPVRDLRSFRSIAIIAIKFGLYCKLVYICIVAKADCAAALGRKNKQNT